MANDISYKLTVATQDAQRNLKAAEKEAKKLGTSLDDSRTKGQKVADFLDKFADEAEADFKATVKAADKLAEALGSEFVAELRQSGKSVEDLVDDLKRMGLTADDVEADVDRLAASLKKTADVGRDIDTHITKNLGKVADEADRSKSVMANAMGNMAQEVPGVAGAFGPLNTAVGQFIEYASEGGIAMRGLVAAAGPIALVGLAIAGITSVMGDNAKRTKFLREQVDMLKGSFEDARENGTSAAKELANKWKENGGKIEAEISNDTATLLEFGQATDDMGKIHDLVYPTAKRHVEEFSDELFGLGMTAEGFARLAQSSRDEVVRWGDEMVAAGFDAQTVNTVMQGAVGLHGQLEKAALADAIALKVFGDEAENAATGVSNLRTATEKLDVAYQKLIGHLDEKDAWDRYLEALWNAHDGLGNAEQDTRDLTRSTADLVLAMEDIPEETKAQIVVALDQGKQAKVDAWLAEKAKGITVPFYSVVVGAGVGSKGGTFRSATGRTKFSGVTEVAEQGAEMVTTGDGTTFLAGNDMQIKSAQKTRAALQSATPSVVNDNRSFYISMPSLTPESQAASLAKFNRRNGQ